MAIRCCIARNGDVDHHAICDDVARAIIVKFNDTSAPSKITMRYPGGKNSSYQKIINLIPPHRLYIEPFVGSGAILRNKLPALASIVIDRDAPALEALSCTIATCGDRIPKIEFVLGDALDILQSYRFEGDEFIYADPPYVLSSRRQTRHIYRYELSDEQHQILLKTLKQIPCPVMISGYWSEMYAQALANWNVVSFEAITRGGTIATEYLWMNYPAPIELHDYRYLGDTFRERERIKRKTQRWIQRLKKMPTLEKQALFAALDASR